MEVLIALIPAFAWGSIGLVSGKLGGTAQQQTLGMTIGSFVFAIGAYIVYQPAFEVQIMIVGLISGLFWTLGQNKQFKSMKLMGVSNTLPVSTGLQLMANTLAGVLLFREWTSSRDLFLGVLALALLIIGVRLTTITDQKDSGNEAISVKKAWMKTLALSTLGYATYTIIINASGVDALAVILPQSIGMVIGALLFSRKEKIWNHYTARNILTGLIWGVGNIFMLISMKAIGLAVSFSLSQMGIIISTLGGIWFLGETKSKREFKYIILGCLLVISGGIVLGYLKS
ncbi:GRP family sugar transporter [Carnobacterium funditum]|uniref:GRP family sugar transporter n=1 Tax=Carnobacterium funditum TaxID=2752 RepID=UPI000558523F|nr:GRP family sugar transporter [Carnobacterium funditum]